MPEEETQLGDAIQVSYNGSGGMTSFTLTIPNGVTVIKAFYHRAQVANGNMVCTNKSNSVSWGQVGSGNSGVATNTVFIGVTAGKTYSLKLEMFGANGAGTATFYYSSSINQETPSITDYI